MHPTLVFVLAQTLYYGSIALTYLEQVRARLWKMLITYYTGALFYIPTARYFLSDTREPDETYEIVPEGAIYVEDWVDRKGTKKSVLRYPGEAIPRTWNSSPFAKHPRMPWVWVGDRETEIDLTRTFNRFLVVGNRITPDLVKKLIQVTSKTHLIYIESGTFKELDFPGDGLTIEEYGSVQNRRPVHQVEEAVPTPVLGRSNDSVE